MAPSSDGPKVEDGRCAWTRMRQRSVAALRNTWRPLTMDESLDLETDVV